MYENKGSFHIVLVNILGLKSYTKIGGDNMIGKEVKSVLKGLYNNPGLDSYMDNLLLYSILRCDMSAYMCARDLRTQTICDTFEDVYEHHEESELTL